MKLISRRFLAQLLQWLLAAFIGSSLMALGVFIWLLEQREDLELWHKVELTEEFTAKDSFSSLSEYLALEERLFAELDNKVYAKTGELEGDLTNRYKRNSLADPERWSRNWNRSFQLGKPGSSRAVLLLHGMSDSPYSMRSFAQALAEQGADVLGLRLPGHGTAPSGLVRLRLNDMRAAVRLAVQHLADRNPGASLELVGYSNGAALALDYSLASLEDSELPRPARLALFSPMIAVSPAARFAVWQARLGVLLGLDTLAWNDLSPEYDPYKYNSFAVNAGDVSYRLTVELGESLRRVQASGQLGLMPPVLSFVSAVDATVSAPAVITGLYDVLDGPQHELVLFDINRTAEEINLLSWDPNQLLTALGRDNTRDYTLSVISNRDPYSLDVVWRRWRGGESIPVEQALDLAWPDNVYSLSHVAVPFSRADSLYGPAAPDDENSLRLGFLLARGERGVLRIPSHAMLRQRWNPFHEWMLTRVLEASP